MTLFVGLDVSQKMTAICVVDDAGRRVWRGQCASDPEQIEQMVRRHAGNDARIDATIPDTVSAMKAMGKTYEPVTYDGAGHGFMRAGEAPDANDANKKARDDAWKRWKTLLAP